LYIVAVFILRAGYEYKNIRDITTKPPKQQFVEYKYYITYKGDEDDYKFNEPKTLYSLLEEIDNMELDVIEYYEGREVRAIGNSSNFEIIVNGEKYPTNFFDINSKALPDRTKIQIIN
jgi:hypothetical protein